MRVLWAVLIIPLMAGCGQQFGAFLYHMGLYPHPKVEAEYTLTKGPLLILVEDDYNVTQSQALRETIATSLADRFAAKKVNRRVIPLERLRTIRQNDPDYDKIPADRLGRMVEAEQVLWIKIIEYAPGDELAGDPDQAALIMATVRVIDAHAEHRDEVRLWPTGREPYRVTVSKPLSAVQRRGKDKIELILLSELVDQIAKLFYEYRIEPE